MMDVEQAVARVVDWINQAEDNRLQLEGYYANGGRAGQLEWVKSTLLTAPTIELKRDLLDHFTGIGLLPKDLMDGSL